MSNPGLYIYFSRNSELKNKILAVSEKSSPVIIASNFPISGEWMWIDNSVVDYTNWQSRVPKLESCVSVSSETGQWGTTSCSRYKSYVCKTAKGRTTFDQLVCTSSHQSIQPQSIYIYILFFSCDTYRKAAIRW